MFESVSSWQNFPPNPYGLRIRYLISDHAVEFEFYDPGMPDCPFDDTMDADDLLRIKGTVNWDGCINWSTKHLRNYHFCQPRDVELLGLMFAAVWRLAEKHVKHWDKNTVLNCPNPLPAEG